MKPFFGYPGGKSRASKTIKELLAFDVRDYDRVVEPFCGGGSFSLSCEHVSWLNDLDADVMCLWTAVRDYPDDLCYAVEQQKVYADLFYELRDTIKTNRPMPKRRGKLVEHALQKLTVHKLSYSNMGEMAASPVGGKNQTGDWKFDVRWNVDSICKSIMKTSNLVQPWELSCLPYQDVLESVGKRDFVFIDPPYYGAGPKCYKNSFHLEDHEDLALVVKKVKSDFAITYDNHKDIRNLYGWAKMADLEFKYFMSTAYRSDQKMKTGKEILITRYSNTSYSSKE